MTSLLRLGWLRTVVELKQLVRHREMAFWTLMFPVVLMVIFGSVFGQQKLGPTGVTFAQYFTAGMIASGVLYTSFQNLAIGMPQEREEGTLKRLQGAPIPKAAYFLGKIGLVFVTYVGQTAVLVAVGVAFYGINLPSGFDTWWRFTWISVLGLISCTLLGIAFSAVPSSGRTASAVVSPIVLMLQFTSGVYFMFRDLPHWMQQFAALFPLKWLTQGMRSVFMPGQAASLETTGSFEVGRTALVLLLWLALSIVMASTLFRWQRRSER
ncbi:MAG: ABC transporter permease [Candidatus Nanopelagicales bacterium]